MLYFLDRLADTRNINWPNEYTFDMFQRFNLDPLPYKISLNDVHLYKERLETNINVFSLFEIERNTVYLLQIR